MKWNIYLYFQTVQKLVEISSAIEKHSISRNKIEFKLPCTQVDICVCIFNLTRANNEFSGVLQGLDHYAVPRDTACTPGKRNAQKEKKNHKLENGEGRGGGYADTVLRQKRKSSYAELDQFLPLKRLTKMFRNRVTLKKLCCVRGRAGRPARPRTQHGYHHDTKVKPQAATAVLELLMMGGGERPKHVEL